MIITLKSQITQRIEQKIKHNTNERISDDDSSSSSSDSSDDSDNSVKSKKKANKNKQDSEESTYWSRKIQRDISDVDATYKDEVIKLKEEVRNIEQIRCDDNKQYQGIITKLTEDNKGLAQKLLTLETMMLDQHDFNEDSQENL